MESFREDKVLGEAGWSKSESGIKKVKLIGLILGAIATVLLTAGMTRGVGAVASSEAAFGGVGSVGLSAAASFGKTTTSTTKNTIGSSSEVCSDPNMDANLKAAAGCDNDDSDVPKRVADIINIFIAVMGVIAVIMIIYGGISLVLSLGNAEKVRKAKNIIIYSAIGLLVVLISFAIINFVLDNVLD